MNTLHIFNTSPFSGKQFSEALNFTQQADGILLTGDAVYALLPNTEQSNLLQQSANNIYVLQEDITARAVQFSLDNVKIVDYPYFVELCTLYSKVVSWL